MNTIYQNVYQIKQILEELINKKMIKYQNDNTIKEWYFQKIKKLNDINSELVNLIINIDEEYPL